MMLFPSVKKRLRGKYRALTFAFGYVVPIVLLGLLLGTLASLMDYGETTAIVLFVATFLVSLTNVLRLAWMVLGTRGEAHYFITFWNLLDTFVANLLANISVSLTVWNVSRIDGQPQYLLSTPDVSPWLALVQLGVYTVNILCGAGILREQSVSLLSEFVVAPQTALNLFVLVLIVAPAAIAALGIHTDEKPGENANGGGGGEEKANKEKSEV